MQTLSEHLFIKRKESKKPEDWLQVDKFRTLSELGSFPLHSAEVRSVDIHTTHPHLILTSGDDGQAFILDKMTGKVVANFNHGSPLIGG
jgi:WD40 repeat protein